MAETPQDPPLRSQTQWKTVGKGLVVAGILAAIFNSCTGDSSTSNAGDDRDEAISVCRDHIRSMLKAPSTAKFSAESATDKGDGTFRVFGYVDSQNSFGAMIRSSWGCTARDQGTYMTAEDANVASR